MLQTARFIAIQGDSLIYTVTLNRNRIKVLPENLPTGDSGGPAPPPPPPAGYLRV
jgi:hypothetical protein